MRRGARTGAEGAGAASAAALWVFGAACQPSPVVGSPVDWLAATSPTPTTSGATAASAPSVDPSPAGSNEVPRCDAEAATIDGAGVVEEAVAVCLNGRFIDAKASVAGLVQAVGTRTGKVRAVKCQGGPDQLALVLASGETVRLYYCSNVGLGALHYGLARPEVILTADPPALEAWLIAHGFDPGQVGYASEW